MLAITARWPPKGVVNSQIECVCAFVDGTGKVLVMRCGRRWQDTQDRQKDSVCFELPYVLLNSNRKFSQIALLLVPLGLNVYCMP